MPSPVLSAFRRFARHEAASSVLLLAASILATLALKDLGLRKVHCKVTSDDHQRVLERVGADETVFSERQSAQSLAIRLISGEVLRYFPLGQGASV